MSDYPMPDLVQHLACFRGISVKSGTEFDVLRTSTWRAAANDLVPTVVVGYKHAVPGPPPVPPVACIHSGQFLAARGAAAAHGPITIVSLLHSPARIEAYAPKTRYHW